MTSTVINAMQTFTVYCFALNLQGFLALIDEKVENADAEVEDQILSGTHLGERCFPFLSHFRRVWLQSYKKVIKSVNNFSSTI
jgi:hypothetical protein